MMPSSFRAAPLPGEGGGDGELAGGGGGGTKPELPEGEGVLVFRIDSGGVCGGGIGGDGGGCAGLEGGFGVKGWLGGGVVSSDTEAGGEGVLVGATGGCGGCALGGGDAGSSKLDNGGVCTGLSGGAGGAWSGGWSDFAVATPLEVGLGPFWLERGRRDDTLRLRSGSALRRPRLSSRPHTVASSSVVISPSWCGTSSSSGFRGAGSARPGLCSCAGELAISDVIEHGAGRGRGEIPIVAARPARQTTLVTVAEAPQIGHYC